MTERGPDRRSGVSSHFTCPHNNRRRSQFERRGTVPAQPPLTPAQQLYGERRAHPRGR